MATERCASPTRRALRGLPLLLLASSTLVAGRPATAQAPFAGDDELHRLTRVDPRLSPRPASAPIEQAPGALAPAARERWDAFVREAGGPWRGFVDRRSGRLESAEGAGIPWIPGRGNRLAPARAAIHLEDLERAARAFLPRVADLLGVEPKELVLDRGRSQRIADHLWIVDFGLVRDGFPVEGSHVVFRVNSGNLVQLGSESLPAADAAVPPARLTREEALAELERYVGGFRSFDVFRDPGSLHVMPVAPAVEAPGTGPAGLALATVWEFTFRRPKVTGTFRARVDAETGEVLELVDVNRYAEATGGVYPVSPAAGPEIALPMPFADLSSSGFTDSAGFHPFPPGGAPVTSSLAGRYVRVSSTCGPIALDSDGLGNLDFGSSPGTDCATPGTGGPGNTHAARSLFYHVNRAAEAARGWLPGNAWLESQITANSEIPDTCNAFWDGVTINFFRSGGGCANSGEIASVGVHEYSHGLDQNDGNGFSADNGTGETYADFTAALATHDSCIGSGFRATPCTGFGDPCTECTGVRDIDWGKHVSDTPHTVESFTRLRCEPHPFYTGPCDRQGHCESQVASEALWDLVARDLPDPGSRSAWAIAERLWYLSRPISSRAFQCDTSAIPWRASGCVNGSLWRALRVVDDDDGNLANGTPHSCHLFAAFDRHGIACPSDPGADVCFSACTPPPAPAVTAAAGARRIDLSWSGAPGAVYDVFRGEAGCDGRLLKIADDVAGGTFPDGGVANGRAYTYQVVAQAAGNPACAAAPSDCASATPVAGPCTPPSAPAGVTAQATGSARVAISWQPAQGALGYAVRRSTTAGGPYQQVALVAAPKTSYVDSGLTLDTTYHYVVSAFSDCAAATSAEVSVTAVDLTCAAPAVLFADGFEASAGLAGWQRGRFASGEVADWRGVQACPAKTGSQIFRFGGPGCGDLYGNGQFNFVRPPAVVVPAGSTGARLSFWHRRDFETSFDGGTLEIDVDDRGPAPVPASAIIGGATYDGILSEECSVASGRLHAFTGSSPQFVRTIVDLDAACAAAGLPDGCAGHTVRLALVTATDCTNGRAGWFLDDVTVTACTPVEAQDELGFYTIPPCRLVDTRDPLGPAGGSALQPGALRTFTLTGACGVPPGAKALSLNLTVTQPATGGHLTLFPAGKAEPITSSINFQPGQTRANNAVLELSEDGMGRVQVRAATAGPVHLIIDVNGYFDE